MKTMRKTLGILALAAMAIAAGSAGLLDTAFGTNGIATDSAFADIRGVAAHSDGSIIAAGAAQPASDDLDFQLAKYDGNGDLDTSFGSNGYVTPFGSDDGLLSGAAAVRADANGDFVAVGYATEETTSGRGKKTTTTLTRKIALVRVDSDGALDNSFGSGGKVLTAVSGDSAKLDALAFQSDGKIVVVGTTSIKPPKTKGKSVATSALLIARYTSGGALDSSFGSGGIVIEDDTSADDFAGMNGVAILSNDDIVVTGATGGNGWVRRYDADGTRNTTFGEIDLGSLQVLPSVAIDGSDRILIAAGDGIDGFVERYDSDGALDTGFASSGRYETNLSGADALRSVNVLSSGAIVCAGQTFGSVPTVFAVRLGSGGSGDSAFGSNGVGEESSPATGYHASYDLTVLPGGDYVLCGYGPGGMLARYCSE